VVPSNRELAGAEVELISLEKREYRLRDALAPVLEDYDFVVIDCPPALNMLTVNGFAAADSVIIPMQCEYYALEGLSDLVGTLRKVKQNLNPRIEIEALVPPDITTRAHDAGLGWKATTATRCSTVICNIRIAAPVVGKPVLLHDPASKGDAAVRARAPRAQRLQVAEAA
jgi:chromosome partitioning protein